VERDQIVIVTNQDDPHADDVIRVLWGMGGEPIRLNTDEIPQYSSLTLEVGARLAGRIELDTNGLVIDVERIRSVWWRRPRRFRVPADLSPWESEFAQEELRQAYRGLWASIDCYWISHPDAIERAEWKLGQLRRARALGFEVPRTLVTSDPAAALDFHEACEDGIVYKVMTGPYLAAERYLDRFPDAPEPEAVQTLTTLLGEDELASLESIRAVPALFQERVPKRVELRVTVIGEDLFVAEIDSQADERTQVDFRADFDAVAFRAGTLPDEIAERCLALVHGYGLNFSAIDLVVTPDDRYVFLESNPNGQFGFVEQLVPELPLTEALATRLLHGGND
jgi:hypothetical protein